jgi:hypothetical protein
MEYVLAIRIFCFEGEPFFVMAKRKREREAFGIIFRERENGEKAYKLVGPVMVIKLEPT